MIGGMKMAYFKEIVTKAVIGKGKRVTTSTHTIKPNNKPDTVLGCWIINHSFNGKSVNNDVYVDGKYDVNVWYSYDADSKTDVCSDTFTYSDRMNVPITTNTNLTSSKEIIVNSLSDPNVVDVSINGTDITFTVRKELGVEIIGDTKMRVNVSDDFDDYQEIYEDDINDDVLKDIDESINEDYIKEENTNQE